MEICKFIDPHNSENSNLENTCKFKPKYGCYCYKHRRNHLIKGKLINIENFTGLSKDYLKSDLLYYRVYKMKNKSPMGDKKEIFDEIKEYINSLKRYEDEKNYNNIVKIQCIMRGKITRMKNVNLKCNNDEDFYTYDPINEIESKYFFSYKDNQNNYWGFDIRSLKKLIDMNYDNPYTTEPIPETIKQQVEQLINNLKDDNIETVINNTIVSDRKTLVKQRFVDIFAQMEYSGYSCDVKWILDLNSTKLKRLYRELEDIWNYRANLSEETKRLIVPPHGRLCSMPVTDYYHCHNRLELREILANEVYKICGSADQGNMNLGFMYFIIALGMVSRPCFMTHNWILSVF